MVNSCCVPECKSGYKSVKKSDTVALFRFPKNEIIRQSGSKRYPVKTGVLHKTIEYALIILMKVILLQSPLIKEQHLSRHAQTRVFRDVA